MSRREIGSLLIALLALCSCTPYGTSVPQDASVPSADVLADLKPVDTDEPSDANNAATDSVVSDSGVEQDNAVQDDVFDTFVEVSLSDTQADTDSVAVDVTVEDASEVMADGLECPEGALCELKYNYACKEGRCNAQGVCVATDIPGCCYSVADCDDIPLGPCEEVQCVSKECTPTPVPGCCTSNADCVTTLSCATSSCDMDTGRCLYCPGDCPCSNNPNVQTKSFDKPSLSANGFSTTDYGSNDNVRWQVDTTRFFKAPNSIYLGDPECRTYYNGLLSDTCDPVTAGLDATAIRIMLYSPTLNLANNDGNAGSAVLFWYWSDVEPELGLGIAEPDALRIFLDVLDGTGVKWTLASILETGKNTFGQWVPMAIDLAPYTNKLSRLRFEFDTYDGQLNDYEGIYIDEFQIIDKCPGGCCNTDLDCPYSGDPCMKPVCLAFSGGPGSICSEAPIDANCKACGTPADCEDNNPCTTNTCTDEGICAVEVFCCYATSLFTTSFEEGLAGWAVSDNNPNDSVSWQTTNLSASDGSFSAWFGDATTSTYETGEPVKGGIVSTFIDLPTDFSDGGKLALEFDVKLDTEWDGLFYLNPLGIDRLSIELLGVGAPKEIWSSDEIGGTTNGSWLSQSVDLTQWAGKTIQLRVQFNSVDGNGNAYMGPMLDNLYVGRVCP